MGFVKEFKDFAMKGNVVDLAIGVIIGGAFGKIVSSFVDDLIMPLINPIMPEGGWQTLVIGPGIKIGNVLSAIVNFIIIAFVLFMVIKAINKVKDKTVAEAAPPTTSEKLLTEIRDALKK